MYRSGYNRAHRWMYGCIAVMREIGENELVMKLFDIPGSDSVRVSLFIGASLFSGGSLYVLISRFLSDS